MAKHRLIIDTDPGIDDVLAMLLAFASRYEELEILLISVTHGNVDVQSCLRNVISIFHVLEKELEWRQENGLELGYETILRSCPRIAVGADAPLEDQMIMADFFHGKDGLGGIHTSHPHLTPEDTWKQLFETKLDVEHSLEPSKTSLHSNARLSYIPVSTPAPEEILKVLAENPQDSVTIVALGPLTNLALAAAKDPLTFLRAREVVVMGGNVDAPGNITPLGEFNCHADPVAFARVLALTSPQPHSTMPPVPPTSVLKPYPASLPRKLTLVLLPLDVTTQHMLTKDIFLQSCMPPREKGSPLAEWCKIFLDSVWSKPDNAKRQALDLHDPLCIWWCITTGDKNQWTINQDEDIRVETTGQWSRGACIVDRRGWGKKEGGRDNDRGDWLHLSKGNNVQRAIKSPGNDSEKFQHQMLHRLFGSSM